MIVRFSKSQFEDALPQINGVAAWRHVGIRGGEHCYVILVKEGVSIFVRSSVKADGLAAVASEDSIRCWLTSDDRGTPLGSKEQRWITRVNGWERRLIETLRVLWKVGTQIEDCPECRLTMAAFKVKKEGPTHGRWFLKCPKCGRWGKWVEKEAA